jgi:hypothetical protein
MSWKCVNPNCFYGEPGDPPEYESTSPVECSKCRETYDAEDDGCCPFCDTGTLCDTEGCDKFQHPESENGYCHTHELDGLRAELKRLWFVNPPNPVETAEAEIQVRRWERMR